MPSTKCGMMSSMTDDRLHAAWVILADWRVAAAAGARIVLMSGMWHKDKNARQQPIDRR